MVHSPLYAVVITLEQIYWSSPHNLLSLKQIWWNEWVRRKAAAALWLHSMMGSMVKPEASAGKGPELEYRLYSFQTMRPKG